MPPLDFPASPITGATYTGPNNVIWAWDGAKWVNGTQIGTAYAPISSPVFTGNPTAPNPPSGDADTSVATTAFVTASTSTALNNVGRNLIHNPLFNVAQRGAGPFNAGGFTLDRWQMNAVLDTMTVGQFAVSDADRAAIGDESATFQLSNSFNGNAGAGAFDELSQQVEGVRRLAGKTVTLSFWAIGSAAFKLGFNASQNFGTGGAPSSIVNVLTTGLSVTLSTTWARYSMTIALPSASGKTLGTNKNDYTQFRLCFSCGATNSAFFGNPGVQSGTVNMWGVQLEVGSVATPLEKPDPRYDVSNCQRFYQTMPFYMGSYNLSGQQIYHTLALAVPMRAIPTVTVGSPVTANVTAASVTSITNSNASLLATATLSSTTTGYYNGVALCSADL